MVAEACEFAVDAAVAPGWVLRRETGDESSEFDRGWWSSWSSVGLGPVAGDSAPMPSEQGVGGDEPAGSARPGECGCDRAEQGAVVVVECWPVDLAAQGTATASRRLGAHGLVRPAPFALPRTGLC